MFKVQGASGTGSPGSQGNQGHQGIQGIQGVQGADGNFGGVTFDYTFNTITTDSDPGQGKLRISEGTFSGALTLFIDDEDVNGDDISSYLQTIDDSTSTLKGHFRITNKANSDDFAIFSITGSSTDGGTYFKVPATYLSGSTSFSNNEDILITFARTGDKGDAGAQGNQGHQGVQGAGGQGDKGGLLYQFNTGTNTAGIGTGQVRFDSATFSNITTIGIHNTDADGNDLEDYIATWDDGGANNDKGTVVIKSNTNGDTTFAIFTITSSNTSTIIGTNARFSVTPLNGNIPSASEEIVVEFIPKGNTGNQGHQGVQGALGAQGNQGHQGVQGAAGTGNQGHQGVQGAVGAQGAQGATGTGSPGAQGNQGHQGVQGADGSDSSVAGPQGHQGHQGVQGAAGAQGEQGAGAQGAQGAAGGPGPQGVQGAAGAQGAQGAAGGPGPQGVQGAAGAQGAQGAAGGPGAQGVQGAQGRQGATGTATINNNADNRVITGSNSSGQLNGETNFISADGNVGIRTADITRTDLVGAGNSMVGLYIGDGSMLFHQTLNRTGGYYISTEVNALNAGPVTLNTDMTIDGNWIII